MYKYALKGGGEGIQVLFETQENVFSPTGTTELLIEACQQSVSSPQKILDLGCGSGVVGIVLSKLGLSTQPVFASDVSSEAIVLAKKNAKMALIEYDARCGSLFEPWKGAQFDVIVDDVAGISDDIAALSSWYPPGVDCNAGKDGTKWIVKIIEQSKQYLAQDGIFIFPLLSISNEKRILNILEKTYRVYEKIMEKDWFFPDEIADREDVIRSLLQQGSIRCHKKFGKWIWSTSIYKAINR